MIQESNTPLWKLDGAKPFIQIKNITKKFGEFTAVDNVSLDIYENELFCLLGGSGSGKSTLLRMLAGFETPTSGQILIDGVDMADIDPWDRPINMMFQSYALFPHMTVFKNIAFGLKRDKVPKKEITERVNAMLKMMQIEEFANRKPEQLSGGQRQRVALARALIKRPKLLLLDEPLGALDKKLREETQFELVNIQDELGVTFVVVTHDQEEAMTLATRIGVMGNGVISQVDEPRDVYEYPRSRFVAEFVGTINIFEGRVIDAQTDYVKIASKEACSKLFVNHSINCAPKQKVAVAVRPEKIKVSRKKPDLAYNCLYGKIIDLAYMGNLSIFRVKLESGKIVRVTLPNLVRENQNPLTWDDMIYLSWDNDSSVVLIS
ncbi:putrescine transport system ATP-binding protein [Colwellia chukchiensis]|uniref:Spermidine/putrescine import ATP-binding protein PotA n=1 Tax=Colwellia chukchiensis TaxID=641665 RepID=A0A1H7G6C6_9GAMM|nr:polyamine ABC transporter ATP-binding protein [Colwellia chukchiensis]SEK33896.1 putrescine transport system ATP-binding protein [Colwellia chukchiensis]